MAGITRLLRIARDNVSAGISNSVDHTSRYSKGLSSEGYEGGYRDALDDVQLALNGVVPNRRGWWIKESKRKQ